MLSQWCTLPEAVAYLQARTGQAWTVRRLVEAACLPHVWIDWAPDAPPDLFAGRTEGFLAPCRSQGIPSGSPSMAPKFCSP